MEGPDKGQEVSENTIMPFYENDAPVEAELRTKCWRWRDLVSIIYGGGPFPKNLDWDEFKEKVSGTEWLVEVATNTYRGKEQSQVVAVMKPEEDLAF